MPVTWKTTDSFERLLAAWWASSETHKPNYRLIAKYYGKGTTYDSIEGRFRHIKRQAEALKTETSSSADGSIDLDSPAATQSFASTSQSFASTSASFNGNGNGNANGNGIGSGSGTPKKARAPRTPKKDATNGGRVSKQSTPTKTPRARKGGAMMGPTPGRHGLVQAQLPVKVEGGRDGRRGRTGGGSMLDELNGVGDGDGEVDWMGGVVEGGFGGKEGDGVECGVGGGVEVGERYDKHENAGYWDGGDGDEEEDLGVMV